MRLDETPRNGRGSDFVAERGASASFSSGETRLLSGVIAMLFAIAILLVPWEEIRGMRFVDFDVYLMIFQPDAMTVREIYEPQTLIDYFTREVLWDELVRLLVGVLGSTFFALKVISAFVLFTSAFMLYQRYGVLLPSIFLLNPLFLDFALSQLRLSFATTLLILAFGFRAPAVKVALLVIACFIHSAMPILIGVYATARIVELRGRNWTMGRVLAVAGGVCAIFAFVLVFGRDALLLAIGDRRAFLYADSYNSTSLAYASFWIGLLAIQLASGAGYLKVTENLFAVMILAMFVALTILNTYGSRFVAAGFPLIVASTLNLLPPYRWVVLPTFLVFQTVQFFYWFQWIV